jgi:hypothetical protein
MSENWDLNQHLRDEHILINIFSSACNKFVYILALESINNRGLLLAWFPEILNVPGGCYNHVTRVESQPGVDRNSSRCRAHS